MDRAPTPAEVLAAVLAGRGVDLPLDGLPRVAPDEVERETTIRLLREASPSRIGVIAATIAADAGAPPPARVSAAKLALECWEAVTRSILAAGLHGDAGPGEALHVVPGGSPPLAEERVAPSPPQRRRGQAGD